MTEKTKYAALLALAEDIAATELLTPWDELGPHFVAWRRRAKRALKMDNVKNPDLASARATALESTKARGEATRERVMPIIHRVTREGNHTFEAIAAALNHENVPAPRGGKWSRASVKRVMDSNTP